MFICVFMAYRLHVHDVFDEMSVMARMGEVNSLMNFCAKDFFYVLFIIRECFIKSWEEIKVISLKRCLRSRCHRHKTR